MSTVQTDDSKQPQAEADPTGMVSKAKQLMDVHSNRSECEQFDAQLKVTPLEKPYRLRGKVVPGFQRGSSLLGCPTANLDPSAFKDVLVNVPRGVYCGWASVDFRSLLNHKSSTSTHVSHDNHRNANNIDNNSNHNNNTTQSVNNVIANNAVVTDTNVESICTEHNKVFPTVLSLGYNPTFGTQEETVEAYILHQYPADFYGAEMSLIICGYMRPSERFTGLDDLIKWIARDVRVGEASLLTQPLVQYKSDSFFPATDTLRNNTSHHIDNNVNNTDHHNHHIHNNSSNNILQQKL